jgi:hypothetical protein
MGILGPDFLHGILEALAYGAGASLGEQSLQAAGIPGPISSRGLRECSSVGLLPTQENQASRWWEFGGLICMGFWKHSTVVLLRRAKSVCSQSSSAKLSSVVLLLGELGEGKPSLLLCTFCHPWSNGAVRPAYTGVLYSLAFHSEGSRCV